MGLTDARCGHCVKTHKYPKQVAHHDVGPGQATQAKQVAIKGEVPQAVLFDEISLWED